VLLTVGAEIGLPAGGCAHRVHARTCLGGLADPPRPARVTRRGDGGRLAAALFAFLVHGIVDYTLRSEVLLGLLWVLAALVVACDRITRGQPASVTE